MKKLDLAAESTISYFGPILFSVALALFGSLGGSARAEVSAPPAAKSDIAQNIKNGVARQMVSDSEKAFRSGHVQQTIILLKRAMAAAPKDGWVRLVYGRVLSRINDSASAEPQFREARADGVPDEIVLSSLFDAMIARHEEQKLLEEFPAPATNAKGAINAKILGGRAVALLSLGRADDAAAAMDRSLSLDRTSDSLLVRAKIAELQNNPSLANGLIEQAFKLDPKNGRAMSAKLRLLVLSNDTTGALALSEQILKEFPADVPTRATRIEIFLKLNQDAKADGELKAMLAEAPHLPIAQYYKALFLARANNVMGAWKIAQTLPSGFTASQPSFAIQVSQMAIKSGNVETGAAILAAAVAKSPNEIDLRLRLAAIRMSQNSPAAALRVMAPIKDTSNPLALDMLGWISLQTNDPKGALAQLTRAHDLQPKNQEITFHLVQALDASGNRNSAKSLLNTLLASGGNFDDLQNARQLAKTWH